MKKYFKYIVVVLFFVLPLLTFAAEFRAGEQASVGKEEKNINDIYMAGGSVTVIGDVKGDLFTAGGNIVVSGDVGADLFTGGGNVNILSNVADDVRALGGTIVIQGKIGGDLIAGGGQINIGGSGVGGDVIVGAGNLRIDAPVAGSLRMGGGNIYINAPIGGDVKIEADKVTLGSNAVISGNLTYKASSEMVKEVGAVVKGKIDFTPIAKKNISPMALKAIFSALLVWKFFALLACALFVGMMFRRYSKELVGLAAERPLFEIGRGVIVMFAMPAISVFLLVTLVGIPFGIIGLLGFAILMLFTWIVTPIIVGSVVYQYFSKGDFIVSWKTILLGVFIFTLLGMVPFIGGVAKMLLTFLVLGSMIGLKMKIAKEWR